MSEAESRQRPSAARTGWQPRNLPGRGERPDGGGTSTVLPEQIRPGVRALLVAACHSQVAGSALKVALVVGTLLNLINQGEALLDGAALSWPQLLLNYGVPYLVSTYSAARQALRNCEF